MLSGIKFTRWPLCVLVAVTSCGCADSPATPAPAPQSAAPSIPGASHVSSSGSTLTLTAGQVFGETKTFQNPDAATAEQQVRALNWQNLKERPLIQLARVYDSGDKSVTLKVQGTLGAPNEDGLMRAGIIIYDPKSGNVAAESPPLESIEGAIELISIALNDPEKLRTIGKQWEQESTVPQ